MSGAARPVFAALSALTSLASIGGVQARAIEEKNIISGKETIAPDKGYIYLVAPGRFAGTLIRQPDAEDIAAYREARAEAFAKAVKKHAKQLARWESDMVMAAKLKKKAPEKPVEPEEATFAFGAIEQTTTVAFGPDYVFSKDREAGRFAYLTEVKPGRYVWYGPVLFDPSQGYIGACYCMGTVQFDVKAGGVTDLGNYLIAAPKAEDQASAPLLDIQHSGGWNGFKVELPEKSGTVSFGLPQSLAGVTAYLPQFDAAGKTNNFYGVMISRLPPIDGVLAYRRDTVIDARTGQELTVAVTPE